MARIVYFYRQMSDYIENDLGVMRERHVVTAIGCPSRWPQPLRLLREIARADVVMAWFASWHSFWPVLIARVLRKPSVVTVGGYDTARLPAIAYGHQRGGPKGWVARATMRLATRLIAISDFTFDEVRGLRLPERKIVRLYLGLDPARYAGAVADRAQRVITVGGVNRSNLTRKGLEPFVRAAALCPDLEFVVVGAWTDDAIDGLRAIAGANVHFTGRVSHADKAAWLRRSQVVVQASQHEAFGLSLAEGMLCGCVPVVTRVGALPEVVGECGIVIETASAEAIARGVREARARWPEARRLVRARVVETFSIDARRRGLEALLATLVPVSAEGAHAATPAAVAGAGATSHRSTPDHHPAQDGHSRAACVAAERPATLHT